ncbi:MAG: hypothetical protein K8R76_00985 [Candidatus Aegiribacteria sp.]|nr:hypothetical protein [Candidatus Aegiribacteria sp.]
MKLIILSILVLITISLAVEDTAVTDMLALLSENNLSGRLAWVSDRYGDSDIFFMDLSEGRPKRVCAFEGEDRHPVLSPEGWRIAWVSEMFGQPDIILVHLGPYGHTRSLVRLTDTPDTERDLDWSADGERLYFSVLEEPDLSSISLFTDPASIENGMIDEISALYYCRTMTGDIDNQSLEPGNYRYPCHVSGFGIVCALRAWESGALAKLAYVHDALVTSDFPTPGDEVLGPIRRYPNGELLVPFRRADQLYYTRIVPESGEVVSEYSSSWDRLNPVPDPADGGSDWYICQTAQSGEPDSEILFIYGLQSSVEPEMIPLTQNDFYDGEPSWVVLEKVD